MADYQDEFKRILDDKPTSAVATVTARSDSQELIRAVNRVEEAL